MLKLTVLTSRNTSITHLGVSQDKLIEMGDLYSTARSYEIVDNDTDEVLFSHCNMDVMMQKEAG